MKITKFENSNIASFIRKGTGTPLVFVHGFCEDSSVWDEFLIKFPIQHTICIDLPGFGASEQIQDYSIARFAEVIHSVLINLGIKKCIYIGHSMGGYVGLEFAKKYNSMLAGFCLFHSHPYADTPTKVENRLKSIDFIKKNGHIYFVKQLIPKLFSHRYASSNSITLTKMIYNASRYTAGNIIAGLEAMINRSDNSEVLSKASFPVLYIIGKEDIAVPDYIEEATIADTGSIHILENVSHMGMLESPQKCEKIIKEFAKLIEFIN